MKLTVNLRGLGPQYFAVTMAMRMGSSGIRKLPLAAAVGPITGAFTGLISRAVLAAFTKSALGSDLMLQPNSNVDFFSGIFFWPFLSFNYSAAVSAQQTMLLKRELPRSKSLQICTASLRSWRSDGLGLIWPEPKYDSRSSYSFLRNRSRKVPEILGTDARRAQAMGGEAAGRHISFEGGTQEWAEWLVVVCSTTGRAGGFLGKTGPVPFGDGLVNCGD